MSHGCSKCAVFFRLNLWPLAAVFDLLCPSSTVARKGSLHSKNYCHGHQSSCSESESPLKILYPEHNQVYHWTFSESESEDPRGPVYYPDIRINVTSSPGKYTPGDLKKILIAPSTASKAHRMSVACLHYLFIC